MAPGASNLYNQSTVQSNLPFELWANIFGHATHVSDALPDLNNTVEFGFRRIAGIQAIRDSFKTKLAIVRVCKAWYTMALPLLFECFIFIATRPLRFYHELLSLNPTLGENRQIDTPNIAKGHWIRRLDIITLEHYGRTYDSAIIHHLFHCMPNVSVFIVGDEARFMKLPSCFLTAVADSFGTSLEFFQATRFWSDDDGERLASFLASTPNLRGLDISDTFRLMQSYDSPRAVPALPKLVVANVVLLLFLYGPIDAVSSLFASSLEVAILDAFAIPTFPYISMGLAQWGSTLSTVVVKGRFSTAKTLWQSLFEHCRSLYRVVWEVSDIRSLFSIASFPPIQVTNLELHIVKQTQARPEVYQQMFQTFASLSWPSLKMIRFLDASVVGDIRKRSSARILNWAMPLFSRSVELQDHKGRPLVSNIHYFTSTPHVPTR